MGIKFLSVFFLLNSAALASYASEVSTCLSVPEIQTVISEFQNEVSPLLNTITPPLEITYDVIPMLADDPVTGYADFLKNEKINIHLSGQTCENGLFHKDELKLLLCHELGHAAGGAPYMVFAGHEDKRVSAEGQADFFATSSCLPKLFANDDNLIFLEQLQAHPELNTICPQTAEAEKALCVRVVLAGFRFAKFIHAIAPDDNFMTGGPSPHAAPELGKKDKVIVAKTLTRAYPSPQCRLDTYIAGFNCQAKTALSNFTENPSAELNCGEAVAVERPSCWFKSEQK